MPNAREQRSREPGEVEASTPVPAPVHASLIQDERIAGVLADPVSIT
jgi:hypothetical protein